MKDAGDGMPLMVSSVSQGSRHQTFAEPSSLTLAMTELEPQKQSAVT